MKIKALLILCLWMPGLANCQEFTGLWEVEKVEVGDKNLTPVAKWTRIHADGTYESGNGWLQNSVGKWTYDAKEKSFLPKEKNGIEEGFGAFTIKVDDEKMVWSRMEEGMQVTVTWQRIEELPRTTADKVVGLWRMKRTVEPKRNKRLFKGSDVAVFHLRWDRIYTITFRNGERQTGYWHMNGHRPVITLLPHQEGLSAESFYVKVNDESLTISSASEENEADHYFFDRTDKFPE